MKKEFCDILDSNRVELVRQIDSDHSNLLNLLLQDKVLIEEHVAEIKSYTTRQKRNEKLLDILKTRDDDLFEPFCLALANEQAGLVRTYLNPPPETDTQNCLNSPPIKTCEFVRLRLVLSRVEEENRELLLENDLLRVTHEKQEVEKEFEELKIKLSTTEQQNEEYKKNGENLRSNLDENGKKYRTLLFEFNAMRKQNTRLNEQLEKVISENKQLRSDLSKAEGAEQRATQIIQQQEKEIEGLRNNILELEVKLEEWEELYPKPLDKISQIGADVTIDGGSVVMGVTWMDSRIYVVCLRCPKIFVFSDQKPFKQIKVEEFEIKEMKNPRDIKASANEKLLFVGDHVSDKDNRIFKIQMPEKKESRWAINRKPEKLSLTISDELLVLVSNRLNDDEDEFFLYIYSSSDGTLIRQIILPNSFMHEALHVVQPSKGIFIISHKSQQTAENGQLQSVWLVSKMTSEGNIVCSFNPSAVDSIPLDRPEYLAIGENNRIIVVDQNNNRVVILGARLTSGQVIIKPGQHQIKKPFRMCYVPEKRLYIVGLWTSRVGTFSVFAH